MYAVERIGSYITRGVYTVSGPFHPFGGAVDIIVVQQQDGSFKSSPWYVRFGKFQGVLKTTEKVVNISVNGVEADSHMYLDHKGAAYFLREVDVEEEDSVLSPSSSGEDTDGQSASTRPIKSKSCNYDADLSNSVTDIDISNGKIVGRTSSHRSRIMGLVFGSKSIKEDRFLQEDNGDSVVRRDSLERAEIAADLLDVNWSTSRPRKENSSQFSDRDILDGGEDKELQINDGQSKADSLANDDNNEENGSFDNEMCNSFPSTIQNSERAVDDAGVELSSLVSQNGIGMSTPSECGLEDNSEFDLEKSRKNEKLGVTISDSDMNAKGGSSEVALSDSQIPDFTELGACPSEKIDEEQIVKVDKDFLDGGAQSFVDHETLESSRIGLDAFNQQAETLHLSCGEVYVHGKTLYKTTGLISSKVNSQPETGLLVANEALNVQEILVDKDTCNSFNDAKILESEETSSKSITNIIASETYPQMVTVDSISDLDKKVESQSILTISSLSNSLYQAQDEQNIDQESSLEPVADLQECSGDCIPAEAINISLSESLVEEQLLFGDLDDFKIDEVNCMESASSDHMGKKIETSLTPRGAEGVNESFSSKYESESSPDKFVHENLPNNVENLRRKSKAISDNIYIPRSSKVVSKENEKMANSLPIMWSDNNDLDAHEIYHSLGHSLDSNSESSKWMLLREDVTSLIKSDVDIEHQVSQAQQTTEDAMILEDLKNVPANPADGDPFKVIDASSGSWRIWSFPFRRSRSIKTTEQALDSRRISDTENASLSTSCMEGEKDEPKPKLNKKKVRAITPTSEQLASLNLKEGRNAVTFTFSTAMLGKQQVEALIYLWRWDTRIVISDVDGTITKSDVLGQFMPMVGKDWSQTGVAHLFSAIKENGFQLLFLSARAISQAYRTRQFLFNLKQDGKALPDGPVVISPDGLFPSLIREVIRRAPHEFKIGCLEDIRALFPPDRNPFYAGFGNRDTDEFSYLKVGIPKGKIFIINPKGEVAVNRRVDTKSYSSLHALVHGMFPSMSSSEQEDFNSWNYWRLPPPSIDI